jgi:hypothetical protein
MTKHYLAMTSTEFEAHAAAIREQIDRVHLRGMIYGVLLLIVGILASHVAFDALAAPIWLTLPVYLALGVVAARVGMWLSWRREGERLTWNR